MSTPLAGDGCALRVSSGQPASPYHPVEGCRVAGLEVVQNEVDITDAGDLGWRRILSGAGIRSIKLDLAGLYLGSPGEILLRSAALSGDLIQGELSLDQGRSLSGQFLVSALRLRSEVKDEATYAVVLQSSGVVSVS